MVLIGIAVVLGTSDSGPGPLGADFINRAAAAVERPGQIEHVRSSAEGLQYEYWSLEDKRSRTVITAADGKKSEYVAGPICSILSKDNSRAQGCPSTGTAISNALLSGTAKVVGSAKINDRVVQRIEFSDSDSGVSGTYDVDPETLAPVAITVRNADGTTTSEQYSLFEYLPSNAENAQLAGVGAR